MRTRRVGRTLDDPSRRTRSLPCRLRRVLPSPCPRSAIARSSPRRPLVILLTWAAVAFASWRGREDAIDDWRFFLANLSEMAAQHADQTLAAADGVLERVVDDVNKTAPVDAADLLAKAGSREMHELLRRRQSDLPQIGVVSLLDDERPVDQLLAHLPDPAGRPGRSRLPAGAPRVRCADGVSVGPREEPGQRTLDVLPGAQAARRRWPPDRHRARGHRVRVLPALLRIHRLGPRRRDRAAAAPRRAVAGAPAADRGIRRNELRARPGVQDPEPARRADPAHRFHRRTPRGRPIRLPQATGRADVVALLPHGRRHPRDRGPDPGALAPHHPGAGHHDARVRRRAGRARAVDRAPAAAPARDPAAASRARSWPRTAPARPSPRSSPT